MRNVVVVDCTHKTSPLWKGQMYFYWYSSYINVLNSIVYWTVGIVFDLKIRTDFRSESSFFKSSLQGNTHLRNTMNFPFYFLQNHWYFDYHSAWQDFVSVAVWLSDLLNVKRVSVKDETMQILYFLLHFCYCTVQSPMRIIYLFIYFIVVLPHIYEYLKYKTPASVVAIQFCIDCTGDK